MLMRINCLLGNWIFTEPPWKGFNGQLYFIMPLIQAAKGIQIRFVSASSMPKYFHFKITFIPTLGGGVKRVPTTPKWTFQVSSSGAKLPSTCSCSVFESWKTGKLSTPLCFNLQNEDRVVERIKQVLYIKHLEQCLDLVIQVFAIMIFIKV